MNDQGINAMGWDLQESQSAENASGYDVAFLLAPDIPIPSPTGNAIATLVTSLAGGIKQNSVVFSTIPIEIKGDQPEMRKFSIAYYQKSVKQSVLDKCRFLSIMKHFLITPIRYGWRKYAKDAADASIRLQVKCLVVEDVADFCWVVRRIRKHGIKVILHQHAFTQRNYQRYLWKRIERNIDRVIFVAQKTRELTEKKHGALKVASNIIYNGVDLQQYDPQRWQEEARELRRTLTLKEDHLVITFIGRFTRSKGILEAMEGFQRLGRKDVGLLLVCGRDQHVDPEFLMRFENLKSNLTINGFTLRYQENIPQAEIPIFYTMGDIIILPSLSHEGLPKVVSEALAMGVPVIASNRGGIWELLSEGVNGWKIKDPVSPQTIHNVLREVTSTSSADISRMKQYILTEDRIKMDQTKMISSFEREITSVIGISNQ